VLLDIISTKRRVNIKEEKECNCVEIEHDYVKPKFKELTKEQIKDIHSRGKITPQEKVKEWEGMDLCTPGDAIGSAAWRCRKFHNCHDCLVDYANEYDEYVSSFDTLKVINPYKIEQEKR
jgi:hypothetical protein